MSKKQKNLAVLASVFLMLLTIAPVSNAMHNLLKKKPAPDALYVNRKPAEPEAADGKDTDD